MSFWALDWRADGKLCFSVSRRVIPWWSEMPSAFLSCQPQQLAIELLLAGSIDSARAVYASSLWVAGGGSDLRAVFDVAEPHFGADSADNLVRQVATAYRPPFFGDRQLSETVLSLWDELSPEYAAELIPQVEISGGDHPNEGIGRRAFLS